MNLQESIGAVFLGIYMGLYAVGLWLMGTVAKLFGCNPK